MNALLDAIMAVMDGAFDPAFGEAWTRRQVAEALTVPGTRALVCGPGGEPWQGAGMAIGFALLRQVLDEEELLLLAVLPGWRRQGVARRLLERCIAEGRQRGVTHLFLEMREDNPAEHLYRQVGFKPIGRRRHYYRAAVGGPRDAITFGLHLSGKPDKIP